MLLIGFPDCGVFLSEKRWLFLSHKARRLFFINANLWTLFFGRQFRAEELRFLSSFWLLFIHQRQM